MRSQYGSQTKTTGKPPRQRWIDRFKEDLKLLEIKEGEQLAEDRERWRGVVEAEMDLQGPE